MLTEAGRGGQVELAGEGPEVSGGLYTCSSLWWGRLGGEGRAGPRSELSRERELRQEQLKRILLTNS